ncbi:MAG: methyltransferase domain-containing protein [Chloroflexota bacterium]
MAKRFFEAECIRGLETFAANELKKAGAKFDESSVLSGRIRFRFGKSFQRLKSLRVVSQVFEVYHFDIPRPKALLGSQNYRHLLNILGSAVQQLDQANLDSFRLEAAGRDSAVFQRLIQSLQNDLGLKHVPDSGELFIRVVPALNRRGWEVLVRQTDRPLSARSWRQFNYKGALAGPVAAVMLEIAKINPDDLVLNLMSGSGTLLADNQQSDGGQFGIDLNANALKGAMQNLSAAKKTANLAESDATKMPFGDDMFDVLFSDLPWGQLVGEINQIQQLYPAVLAESWRVAKSGCRFVVITQLKKQMHSALNSSNWQLAREIPLKMDRVNPNIYLLKK